MTLAYSPLIDTFLSGTSIAPLIVNEQDCIKIIQLLGFQVVDFDAMFHAAITDLYAYETEENTIKVEMARTIRAQSHKAPM